MCSLLKPRTGAGSAGCPVARTLSEDPSSKVLLLEAGPRDWHPFYAIPAGFAKMTKGIGSWGWSTVPQRHMNNMVIRYTQAKVIGGGSSINAQIYTRGNAQDYDDWRQMGCAGWGYDDVLPYFLRSESNWRGAGRFHNDQGPLQINPIQNRHLLPDPLREAAVVDVQAGLVVELEAAHVEVGGAHRHQQAVGDQRLHVHHRRLVDVDLRTALQQVAPDGARRHLHQV